MKFSDYKKPCKNVGGILRLWLQNSCDVSEDISQELTFVTEPDFYPSSEFAEYQFTRESARITEEEINNKNGRLVIYKLRFNLAKATIENEREINKLRNSDKIIVVAQDNNKQFRVFGNKCNPAEIRITYNSGTTKGNENIYSVEITSAEVQKPYRLPVPSDPPYVPPPRSIIPIYLNIASRTLVFKANWDYLSQRIYRMYGGLTTDSFVFKVNPNPLAVDESHPSWAALPYLNHAEFIASTINQDFQIWIECVFIDLLVTEVLLETGKASINLSNTILIEQHYQTAASDIMLALPTVGSSSTNFSSAIASNIFYGRRENADFITAEDFTDFSNTLADVNAGLNFSDVAHIHFENTVPLTVPTHFKTINVNFGSGNYEVAQVETPLKKRYYPFSENPNCWENDWNDDALQITDVGVKNAINWTSIPNNEYLIYSFTVRYDNSQPFDKRVLSLGDSAFAAMEINQNGTLNLINNISGAVQFHSIRPSVFPVLTTGEVYTITACIKKLGNTANVNTTFDVANSFFIYDTRYISASLYSQNMTSPFGDYGNGSLFLSQTTLSGLSSLGYASIKAINHFGFSVLASKITKKEVIKYALRTNYQVKQYEWSFNTYSSPNVFNGIGTLSSAIASGVNHNGLLKKLYLT